MPGGKEKFYSQNGEDFLLWRFFGEKPKGFFIDVGAFDGMHLSNTYWFEKAGWDGVCFEPHPVYFERCRENRPASRCIHAACTGDEETGEVEIFVEELGLLSSLETRDEDDIRSRYAKRGLEFKGLSKTRVPATTLAKLLKSLNPSPEVDFISIDVEGHELEVLKGLNLKHHRPRVIVVEANTPEDEKQLDQFLADRNGFFKVRRVGENLFYCRDEADVEDLRGLRVACKLFTTDHPLGKAFNPPRLLPFLRKLISRILRRSKDG